MILLSLHPGPPSETARLQQPARRAFALADKCLQLLALLRAQPHHILLYRNLLPSHDPLRRANPTAKANHPFLSNWLKRTTRLVVARRIESALGARSPEGDSSRSMTIGSGTFSRTSCAVAAFPKIVL